MDTNWQTPSRSGGPNAYATSDARDLEGAWGSSAAGAATAAPEAPKPPTPPTPPRPPVAPAGPGATDVVLPATAPKAATKNATRRFAPRLRGREARMQVVLVSGFVVVAVLAAALVALALAKDTAPPSSRVATGPGGPNPFTATEDPVPALTENDSVLPPADPALLPDDPAAATPTTVAPGGAQATGTPSPASGSAPTGGTTAAAPAPPQPKSVTLVYSATPSGITINGSESPALNVGDKLVLKRASGEAGGVAVAADPSFTEARNGYDFAFTVTAAGQFPLTIQSNGQVKAVQVSVS